MPKKKTKTGTQKACTCFYDNVSFLINLHAREANLSKKSFLLLVALCKSVNVTLPVNVSPAILMSFHTNQRFVNRIVSNPMMEIRAASHTLALTAENYIDESPENHPHAIAQRTLKEIKKHWQGIEQIKLANVMVGKRPIPEDGLPIIGRTTGIEGLYLLVMHSGVTLAAIAGRLAAAEILSGQNDILLSPYQLERF